MFLDYRKAAATLGEAQYDAIVSIEMLEAVGQVPSRVL